MPAPSHPLPQLRASSTTDHTLHSDAPAPRNITVGSIANAYFGSAPGGAFPAWGQSQLGPAPEASQAAAMAGYGSSMFQSPAGVSPSSDPGQLPHTSDAMSYMSNYLAGPPREASSAAGLHVQQLPQQHMWTDQMLEQAHSNQGNGVPADLVTRRSHGSGASTSSSNRARAVRHGQQGSLNAAAVPRSPKAAANSPTEARTSGASADRASRNGAAEAEPQHRSRSVRSPPRYHEAR